jgi:hypothetical protein
LRNSRRIDAKDNPEKNATVTQIHNQWLAAINGSLRRDCILTEKLCFETQAIKHQLVLNTLSGLLMNEDSLPDDWINMPGV